MAASTSKTIDELWEHLWAAGITNPVVATEQVGFLLLLRQIDLTYPEDAPESPFGAFPNLRWEKLRRRPIEGSFESLRIDLTLFLGAAIPGGSFPEAMAGASFHLPTPQDLARCIRAIDELELGVPGADSTGEVFEQLLLRLQISSGAGGVTTPRSLIRAIVDVLGPQYGETVCDPTAGTGGFLVEAVEEIVRNSGVEPPGESIVGFDRNPGMVRLGTLNLVLHGIAAPSMHYEDTLSSTFVPPPSHVVMANPPFGLFRDEEDIREGLGASSRRSDLMILELCRTILRPGGRAAVIVPHGLLSSQSKSFAAVRRRLVTGSRVDAVVTLPASTFGSASSVRTAVIFFSRAADPGEEILFCSLEPQPDGGGDAGKGDLEYLADAIRARLGNEPATTERAGQLAGSFRHVPIDAVEEKGWDLSPGAYIEEDAADVDADPLQILASVEELEDQIQDELAEARSGLRRER